MRKDLWSISAMVNFIILVSSFMTTSVFAQGSPYSEEYMEEHDGGDRVEYLQETEYSDPLFYVPPVMPAFQTAPTAAPLGNIVLLPLFRLDDDISEITEHS